MKQNSKIDWDAPVRMQKAEIIAFSYYQRA